MNRLDDSRYDLIYLNTEDNVASRNSQVGDNFCVLPAQMTPVEQKIGETDTGTNLDTQFSQIQEIGLPSNDGEGAQVPHPNEINLGHSVFDNTNPPLADLAKNEDGFYYCRYCNQYRSPVKKEVVRHENTHVGPSYECMFESCDKMFTRKEHMLRHYVSHTGQRPYQCPMCEKSFKRKDHMIKHERRKHTRLQCRFCIHTFIDEESLRTHEEIIHENKSKLIKIEVEVKREYPEDILKVEIDSDRMEGLFSCRFCSYTSSHRNHLESHERTHSIGGGDDETYVENVLMKECYVKCEMGGGERDEIGGREDDDDDSSNQIEIEVGKEVSNEIEIFVGGETKDDSNQSGADVNYLVLEKKPDNTPPTELYTCNYCNKVLKNRVSLIRHTRHVHVTEAKQQCKFCDKRFVRRDHLKKHLLVHLRQVEREKVKNKVYQELVRKEDLIRYELDGFLKKNSLSVFCNSGVKSGGLEKNEVPFNNSVMKLDKLNRNEVPFNNSVMKLDKLNKNEVLFNNSVMKLDKLNKNEVPVNKSIVKLNSVNKNEVTFNDSVVKLDKLNKNEVPFSDDSGNLDSLNPDEPATFNGNVEKLDTVGQFEKGKWDVEIVTGFSCRFCGEFSCDSKQEMLEHEKTHGYRNFQCSYCDASFSRQHHLNRHVSIHTGEKQFNCDMCDKSFYRKDHLDKHIRAHYKEKPYRCSFCDKTFSRHYTMRDHERRHTEKLLQSVQVE